MTHWRNRGLIIGSLIFMLAAVLFTGCSGDLPAGSQVSNSGTDTVTDTTGNNGATGGNGEESQGGADDGNADGSVNKGGDSDPNGSNDSKDSAGKTDVSGGEEDGNVSAFTDPESVAVLVNKEYALPEDYNPTDLVYPDVRFTFKEKIEKRQMRSEAAAALEKMFAGAEQDGIYLAGVSAYRSHSTQTSLFNRYVKKDGLDKAKTYSAVPGHSEHETGLAIDVSGSDGKCAAEDCFGGTEEAKWLAEHAPEYGFIIRYPEGKEEITGYKYEPWHLRYVGKEIAAEIAERDITLEEYYDAIPVSANQ